jgi:GTP pyrophosphokinase
VKISDIENEYKKRLSDLNRLKDESLFIINKGISDIKTSAILARIKTFESFKDKIGRGDYDKPFEQINDILGIRVVALFRSDLTKISQKIDSLFEIVSEDNKLDDAPVDSFGYLSVHFIVKLKPDYSGPRYDGLHDICFEIQTRTIAMDAWASISHFLDYKTASEVPKELRKDFYALSGLFYLADTHFEIFYNSRIKSSEHSKKLIKASKDYSEQELNLDTLKAYLDKKYHNRKRILLRTASELIKELYEYGYENLGDLDKMLDCTEEAFKMYEKKYPPRNTKRFAPAGVVRGSLSLINREYEKKHKSPKLAKRYAEFEEFVKK